MKPKKQPPPQPQADDEEEGAAPAPAPGFGSGGQMSDMGPQPGGDTGDGGDQDQDQGQDNSDGSADERQPATPEEQQQYDEFVAQALLLIAKNKPVQQKIAAMLSAGRDPVEALATASYLIFEMVFKSAQGAGKQFDPGVLMAAGEEINQHIASFGKARKIADYSDDDIDAAFLKAVDLFRQRNPQLLDPATAQQDLKNVQSAEQQGNLDQVAPGLAGALEKLKGLGQAATGGQAPGAPPQSQQPAPPPGGAGGAPGQGPAQ